MTALPTTYQPKYAKPDRATRKAKRAERQRPIATLALLATVRQTALVRLPKLTALTISHLEIDECPWWDEPERWADECVPADEPFPIDTTPLVKAFQRKEDAVLLKVPATADCLQTSKAEVAPVPVVAQPADYDTAHAARLAAQRLHIANIGRVDTADRRLWETDREAWNVLHGNVVVAR
jgi:hypothetical protein